MVNFSPSPEHTLELFQKAVQLHGGNEQSFSVQVLRYGGNVRKILESGGMSLRRYAHLVTQLEEYIDGHGTNKAAQKPE